jgi:hypothetical protein
MASYGGTDRDRGRCAILKIAAQITITYTRLVDTVVLEGMPVWWVWSKVQVLQLSE